MLLTSNNVMKPSYQKYYIKLLADRDETQALLVHHAQDDQPNAFLNAQAARKLDRIERALDRIQTDTYGICVDCVTPISVDRLDSLPYAELCLACQLKQEAVP